MMSLHRIVGLSPTGPTPLWANDGVHVLYAADCVCVLLNTSTMQQRFLLGHTEPIVSLILSSTGVLATAQALCSIF